MSRTIKIIVQDSDYARISKKYPNIEEAIRQFLGCSEVIKTDREKVIDKIRSFEIGRQFTYRDVFDNDPDKCIPSNAKMVRNLCRELKCTECLGYDNVLKNRTYVRIKEEGVDVEGRDSMQ